MSFGSTQKENYEKHEITASIGSLWSLPDTLRVWFYRYPLGRLTTVLVTSSAALL